MTAPPVPSASRSAPYVNVYAAAHGRTCRTPGRAAGQGAFLLRMVMEPPWSVRIEDRAPLCLMSMTAGEAWIVPAEGAEPVLLRPGDLAVARGPEPYTVADRPGTAPQTRIGPGGTCTTLRGEPLSRSMRPGVRTWGNAQDGAAAVAADLLRETDATVEAVARKAGYSQAFAFSTAFKRVRGVGPQEYRNGSGLPDRQESLRVG